MGAQPFKIHGLISSSSSIMYQASYFSSLSSIFIASKMWKVVQPTIWAGCQNSTRACVQNAEYSVWHVVNDPLMVVVLVLSPMPECSEDQVPESGGLSAWGKGCPLPQLLLCEAGWPVQIPPAAGL